MGETEQQGRQNAWSRSAPMAAAVLLLCAALLLDGCARLKPPVLRDHVYVVARQTFLRDRVAAVSNRTGTVSNGDRLEVLERGRRFLRVQTESGTVGWIDEKAVAAQAVYDTFEGIKAEHKADPAIASAVVRDEVYLHVKPGRDTDRFFRLAEGEKLKLLSRATLPKAAPGGPAKSAAATPPPAPRRAGDAAAGGGSAEQPPTPEAPPMEDWWLVRDSQGRTGWMLSRMMDVDAPDTLTRYSEGQRFVGAYVLTRVNDPEAPMEDKDVPVYLAVLSPYKAGLPYDFDQVRVFTWNSKKHRYETGFRERNIEGFLPVEIRQGTDPYSKGPLAAMSLPTFSYRVLPAEAAPAVPDPVTGKVTPVRTLLKTYRLEGSTLHRLLPPGVSPPEEAHPNPVDEKKKSHRRR